MLVSPFQNPAAKCPLCAFTTIMEAGFLSDLVSVKKSKIVSAPVPYIVLPAEHLAVKMKVKINCTAKVTNGFCYTFT
jgi:hypothetical protein